MWAGWLSNALPSMNTLRHLPRLMEKATLYTHLNVREDALDLFGFTTQAELNCFSCLPPSAAWGPKGGSRHSVGADAGVRAAWLPLREIPNVFAVANGVGPKLAQRITLELKDKVKDFSGTSGWGRGPGAGGGRVRLRGTPLRR